MHTDARKMEKGSLIEGDICIVGAGAAGISLALEWQGMRKKVILLEGGGFEYDDRMQDLFAGKTTGQPYFPLRSARLHYFGGTTGHWSGFSSTLDPIDFEQREWVPHSGWPINFKDLDPFYKRAHPLIELGPYEYSVDYWKKKDPEMTSILADENTAWNKIWQFSPPTRFGKKYKDAVTGSPNIHLYTYANVTEINANESLKEIESLTVKNHEGKIHTVKAKYFVLACCAVQNARLLLASNKRAPKGLGNEHDQVGRFFMEHLEVKSAELWLTQPLPMNLYNYKDKKPRAELAIRPEVQKKLQILNGTSSLSPLKEARARKAIIDLWSDPDPRKGLENLSKAFRPKKDSTASAAVEIKDSPLDRAYEMFTRIEQAPNPDSRITLDQEKDALGVPRSKLHWALTEMDKRSIRTIYRVIGREVGRAGTARVRLMEYLRDDRDNSWPNFTGGGWHHMGTTRMHSDPTQGVVDANCKVFGLSNLYIAGSSCFTTAGAANPTLTLIALTLRLSDHLKKRV